METTLVTSDRTNQDRIVRGERAAKPNARLRVGGTTSIQPHGDCASEQRGAHPLGFVFLAKRDPTGAGDSSTFDCDDVAFRCSASCGAAAPMNHDVLELAARESNAPHGILSEGNNNIE